MKIIRMLLLFGLVGCWSQNGFSDYAKAQKYLKEAVRLDPDNVSFVNSLAICYRDAKDYEKSLHVYNTILKKEPDNHSILFNKSLTLILVDRKEEAIKTLKRVLKIEPSFTKARDKLTELGAKED